MYSGEMVCTKKKYDVEFVYKGRKYMSSFLIAEKKSVNVLGRDILGFELKTYIWFTYNFWKLYWFWKCHFKENSIGAQRCFFLEPFAKFLEEEVFSFQLAISKFVSEHDIPLDLVLNLDQTSLPYVSPGIYTFYLKGSTKNPIKGVDDKRQIIAIFTVSPLGSFHLFNYNGSIMVKPGVVYPNTISLIWCYIHSKSLVQFWKMCQLFWENYLSLS